MRIIIFLFIFLIFFSTVLAEEFESSSFKVLDPVLTPGSFSSSGSYQLWGSISEIATGISASASFGINAGFLFFPSISTSTIGAVAQDGKAGLYWSSATGGLGWTIGGYNIGRSTTSGGPYTYAHIGNFTNTATSSLVNNLTNGTTYYFVVRAEDVFGNSVATSTEVSVTPTANQPNAYLQTFATTQATTTTFSNPNSTSISFDIPADVLSSGVNLNTEFHSIVESAVIDSKPLPSGKLGANTFYELSFYKQSDLTQVTSFDKPISLTFTYTDSDISGIDESTLVPYRWNGSSWTAISGSSVNTSSNTVTFSTSNFSNFALLGTAPSSSSQTQTTQTASVSNSGGGGGGYAVPITSVIFSGRAYPLSKVVVLKDGQIAVSTIAGPDARFEISVSGLTSGNYSFVVYGEDNKGTRSDLFVFSLYITFGVNAKVGGIFIAPTIAVDKKEVKRGDNISIFGQSAPNSEITVEINSDEEFFGKTKADQNGIYLYNFDTSPLTMEQHLAKSKSAHNGEVSSFGKSISFIVGVKNVAAELLKVITRGDLNNDKRVNLIDFSIFAYWYKKPNPPAAADLNGDGKVNLVDFSIMAFYWTG